MGKFFLVEKMEYRADYETKIYSWSLKEKYLQVVKDGMVRGECYEIISEEELWDRITEVV